MPKAKGEGLNAYAKPYSRFSKYAAKKQAQRNFELFRDFFEDLQRRGHHYAALDLSREACGAAQDRYELYKPKPTTPTTEQR